MIPNISITSPSDTSSSENLDELDVRRIQTLKKNKIQKSYQELIHSESYLKKWIGVENSNKEKPAKLPLSADKKTEKAFFPQNVSSVNSFETDNKIQLRKNANSNLDQESISPPPGIFMPSRSLIQRQESKFRAQFQNTAAALGLSPPRRVRHLEGIEERRIQNRYMNELTANAMRGGNSLIRSNPQSPFPASSPQRAPAFPVHISASPHTPAQNMLIEAHLNSQPSIINSLVYPHHQQHQQHQQQQNMPQMIYARPALNQNTMVNTMVNTRPEQYGYIDKPPQRSNMSSDNLPIHSFTNIPTTYSPKHAPLSFFNQNQNKTQLHQTLRGISNLYRFLIFEFSKCGREYECCRSE